MLRLPAGLVSPFLYVCYTLYLACNQSWTTGGSGGTICIMFSPAQHTAPYKHTQGKKTLILTATCRNTTESFPATRQTALNWGHRVKWWYYTIILCTHSSITDHHHLSHFLWCPVFSHCSKFAHVFFCLFINLTVHWNSTMLPSLKWTVGQPLHTYLRLRRAHTCYFCEFLLDLPSEIVVNNKITAWLAFQMDEMCKVRWDHRWRTSTRWVICVQMEATTSEHEKKKGKPSFIPSSIQLLQQHKGGTNNTQRDRRINVYIT